MRRFLIGPATGLWLVLLVCFYLPDTRHPRAPVADALSRAWEQRFWRIGDSCPRAWLRDFCHWMAGQFSSQGGLSCWRASPDDQVRVAVLLAWMGLSVTALVFGLWWGWRRRLDPDPPLESPQFLSAWGGFVGWQLALILLSVFMLSVLGSGGSGLKSLFKQLLASGLGLGLATWVWPQALRGQRKGQLLAWGVAGYGLAAASVFLVEWVQTQLGRPGESVNPLLGILQRASGAELAGWFLVIVVIGPALEEIWFRSILLGGFSRILSRTAAVGVTAAIFAAIHVDPQALLQLFALGAVFGWVRCRSGSWLGSYVSHLLWNLSTFLLVSLA